MSAPDVLRTAAETIEARAAERDKPEGERSMARVVQGFNALSGHKLSETDGWLFMAVLKIGRHYGGSRYQPDDFVDLSAYGALAGEAAETAHKAKPSTAVDERVKKYRACETASKLRFELVNCYNKFCLASGACEYAQTVSATILDTPR